MKKIVVSILTLLTCGAAYALPIGNPSEASLFTRGAWWNVYDENCDTCASCDDCGCCWFGLRVGFYGDYVFERHLEAEAAILSDSVIQQTQLFTNAGYIALNFCNWLDVFATLGATRFHVHSDDTSFLVGIIPTIPGSDGHIEFDTTFSWSVGARATLLEWCRFAVGVEGQYFEARPHLNYYLEGATFFHYFDGVRTRYQEAQVGAGISYSFCACATSWIPYIAAKWSWARWDLNDELFLIGDRIFLLPKLRNHKHWGYAVGLTTTFCRTIGVTVEGRWGDEKAVYVNGQFRF